MTSRRKEIKKRLREIARDPAAPGVAEEAQRLMAEYKRLGWARTAEPDAVDPPAARRSPSGKDGPADGTGGWAAEEIAALPPELRARISRSSFTRVIDRPTVEDPGGWGTKNDLRRRR